MCRIVRKHLTPTASFAACVIVFLNLAGAVNAQTPRSAASAVKSELRTRSTQPNYWLARDLTNLRDRVVSLRLR